MKNDRRMYAFSRWAGLSAFLLVVLFMSGCVTQQYNIRVESKCGVPEPDALVVIAEGSKLPAKALLYLAWGSFRSIFTGEDAISWIRRVKHYPPVMVGVTDKTGAVTIVYPRTNVHIFSINSTFTRVWSDSKHIKRCSKSVDYMLSDEEVDPDARGWYGIISSYLDQALKREENQRPEIIEYKSRLEKLIEEQPIDGK